MENQRKTARANALAQDKKSNTSIVVGAAAIGVPKVDPNMESAKIANRLSYQPTSTAQNTYTPVSQPIVQTTAQPSSNSMTAQKTATNTTTVKPKDQMSALIAGRTAGNGSTSHLGTTEFMTKLSALRVQDTENEMLDAVQETIKTNSSDNSRGLAAAKRYATAYDSYLKNYNQYRKAVGRQQQIDEWEANRPLEDLGRKRDAAENELYELYGELDFYTNLAKSGSLTEEQQETLLRIETAIENGLYEVEYYDSLIYEKHKKDWEQRNFFEIMEADANIWNPKERIDQLSAQLAARTSANDSSHNRMRSIYNLQTDLLDKMKGVVDTPVLRNALKKELLSYGYSRKQVSSWLDYAEQLRDAETYEKVQQASYTLGNKYLSPKNSLLFSMPFSLLGGVGYYGALGQKVENALTGKDTPINYKSTAMLPKAIADGMRRGGSDRVAAQTKNGVGKLLNYINPEWDGSKLAAANAFGYNLTGAMVDSGAVVAMSAAGIPAWIGTFALGSSTATTAMQEAHERGATESQSLWVGGIAGLTEMLFSDAAIEKFINLKNPQMAKQLVFNKFPMKGVMEIAGDTGVNVVNTVVDAVVMKDKSKLVKTKQTYMMNGYSEADAERMAVRDWSVDLALDVGIGSVVNLSSAAAAKASQIKWRENASSSQISDFVTNAYNNKNTHGYLRLFEASNDLAANLWGTGVDVNGYVHVLQDNDIRHIREHYGDLSNAKNKVTSEDITNAMEFIGSYDKLYLGKDLRSGRTTIMYEKTTDQKIFLVEEISDDGTLNIRQIIKTGKHNKPGFLQRFKLITDRTPDTDVPAKPDPAGPIGPPGKHVQDAEEAASYNKSLSPGRGFVKGEEYDPLVMDEKLWERLFLLGFERGFD